MHLLLTRLYYAAKPWLPLPLRMSLRKMHVRSIQKKCADIWPIYEAAGHKPDGWPGWPDGKQFAVVLTHDVESDLGLGRVKLLAKLEMDHGVRSSFNFIPEGPYQVPPDLRHWLTDHGFEVGVHDLHHDGKLYWSRKGFSKKAERINHYLKEWNAVGYRSGFMHHELDWHHDLNILYDASTFDTDPFEPQPDGVHTIFPFWVPRIDRRRQGNEALINSSSPLDPRRSRGHEALANSSPSSPSSMVSGPASSSSALRPLPSDLCPLPPPPGYVELPYTLPQDSTLFLFLGETTIDIWKKKLEWIVARGGMALLNVHPDYDMGADGTAVVRYGEFLRYLTSRHKEAFWNPLPKEMAHYALGSRIESLAL